MRLKLTGGGTQRIIIRIRLEYLKPFYCMKYICIGQKYLIVHNFEQKSLKNN